MRLAAAVTAVSSCLFLTACGGSGGEKPAAGTTPGGGETLKALWRASGDDVAVVPGTSDYEPGVVRVSFLVVDSKGRQVLLPSAQIWVARGLDDRPFFQSTAKLERIAIPGGAQALSTHIYVTHVRIRKPGTYQVAGRFENDDVRFIHVEVYEDNDPANGYNRWMREWGLETEPWTFLVNRNGKIADRFEGPLSGDELEQAVREKLLAS